MIWFKFNGTEYGISSTHYVGWGKRSHMGQIDKWYLELKKGTQKDPMEGHQKIPKRAVKDP